MFLKERYRIISQIGQGGQGAIYKAEDTDLGNRLVAVKEMNQGGLSPKEVSEAAEAFKHEAHMLAGLQHPNIPSIYDYFSEAGCWYLVMEFIEGETLEDYFARVNAGKLPVKEVLDIGIQLCDVLAYLHNHQPPIIFRDLKPGNVMRTPDGHLYLIDFGIARLFKPGQSRDTTALGSIGYAAPEQYGKAQTTARSDIFSLGVILHQALTGNDPLSNKPTLFDFPPLNLPGGSVSRELQTLINHMLDKQEDKRPDSKQVVQELQRLDAQYNTPAPITTPVGDRSTEPVISTQSVPYLDQQNAPLQMVAPGPAMRSPSLVPARRGLSRSKTILAIVAIAALVVVGSGIGWWASNQQAASSPQTITSPSQTVPSQETTTNTVHIRDQAGVLDSNKVQNEAAKLPYPIDIYTVNDFTGTTKEFDQRTSSNITDPRLIVIAIDTVHRHISIRGGTAVPLRNEQYQRAVDAFISAYPRDGYTGATVVAIRSLQGSLSQ